ncbi:amidase signature domain-containing protein [Amylostereum chailletii]|nr:amidase signature domain-containing protein [Amylostereum chailletii]
MATPTFPDLYEASIAELQAGLTAGNFTTVDLVKAYLARIDEVNLKGAALRAIIETNPHALTQAAALDAERASKGPCGPLHGIPILLKDNIATDKRDGMQTTAGSYAFLGAFPRLPSTTAARLTASGALLLAKANLSEWSNFRGKVPNGFSARGGQCTSAYLPHGDPGGSSSGSAVGVAVGLAAGAIGTETDGSILSPAGRANVVGLKPTVGLTSRAGVIPISKSQDSVGPIARTVTDAALLLAALAGPDPRDPATLPQPFPVPDYPALLHPHALHGARLGVPRRCMPDPEDGATPAVMRAFEAALDAMKARGAVVVEGTEMESVAEMREGEKPMRKSEMCMLETEFKMGIAEYISDLEDVPSGVRDLETLIAFNLAHAEQELVPPYHASQSRLYAANARSPDAAYDAARAYILEGGRARGIDGVLKKHKLDALVLPTNGFCSMPAAIAGYPVITSTPPTHSPLPLGFQPDDVLPTDAAPLIDHGHGTPFGLAFVGTAWSEGTLLALAHAFELETRAGARLGRRAYEGAVPRTQMVDVVGR